MEKGEKGIHLDPDRAESILVGPVTFYSRELKYPRFHKGRFLDDKRWTAASAGAGNKLPLVEKSENKFHGAIVAAFRGDELAETYFYPSVFERDYLRHGWSHFGLDWPLRGRASTGSGEQRGEDDGRVHL